MTAEGSDGSSARRLRRLFSRRWTVGALVRFHTAHKLLLLAHSPEAYRQMGRLVAHARAVDPADLALRYSELFMAALAVIPTRGRHANVLQHMAGYLTDRLDASSKAALVASIEGYRRGVVPLVVPLTLLRHHVMVHRIAYLADQRYLGRHVLLFLAPS